MHGAGGHMGGGGHLGDIGHGVGHGHVGGETGHQHGHHHVTAPMPPVPDRPGDVGEAAAAIGFFRRLTRGWVAAVRGRRQR
jgi:hypothetical protein